MLYYTNKRWKDIDSVNHVAYNGMGAALTYEAAKDNLDKANIPNEIKYNLFIAPYRKPCCILCRRALFMRV